ncbi:MAG: hypothetical protein KatS3mg122_1321 [Caldimonas sp.]|uniref:hypothetical protein n=1 Tax=Caldimonas taiwanensis TaxID=307483 RepID=UPI0007821C83|nr:hypothetical protein [Caldimonas taiwanensis]GIX24090.1 MAG: hypothetical protein KatS3mg122_1321 [Caldimonas sp.]
MQELPSEVPPSFVALFQEPGRLKPNRPWAEIAQRHELCEDLAQMLTETARTKRWELHATEADVLARIGRGLHESSPLDLSPQEVQWVLRRLAELLGWAPC